MDPYNSPYIIPTHSPHNPFPHSLLRTRKSCTVNLRKYSKKVNNAKAEKSLEVPEGPKACSKPQAKDGPMARRRRSVDHTPTVAHRLRPA